MAKPNLEIPAERPLESLIDDLEPMVGDPGAPTLMVSFAGARLGMGISKVALRKCIADVPVQVVITPDVFPWWWAEGGILGGAPDGMPSAKARAALQARWPHKRLICEGTSFGATTALAAGSLFGAELVLAFAVLSFTGSLKRRYYRDSRWPENAKRTRMSPAVRRTSLGTDLRRGLRNPGYKEALLIADETDRLDALHARRLLDLPRTGIRWEQAGGHSVLRAMYLAGTLGPFLADAVAGRTPGAAAGAPSAAASMPAGQTHSA
ncbi:MAG TPA: hypothetical protein VFX38_00815 [Gammaproteobacteria bacterium]|nr:hypothetical protein [Gammaproteobacteria bacterium]